MAQVSKRWLKPDIEKRMNGMLADAIALCSTKASEDFITDLLTPTEKIVLAKRLSIAYLLMKRYSYEAICNTLKVSSTTVCTVARILATQGNGLKWVLNEVAKKDEWKLFLDDLVKSAAIFLTQGKKVNHPKPKLTKLSF